MGTKCKLLHLLTGDAVTLCNILSRKAHAHVSGTFIIIYKEIIHIFTGICSVAIGHALYTAGDHNVRLVGKDLIHCRRHCLQTGGAETVDRLCTYRLRQLSTCYDKLCHVLGALVNMCCAAQYKVVDLALIQLRYLIKHAAKYLITDLDGMRGGKRALLGTAYRRSSDCYNDRSSIHFSFPSFFDINLGQTPMFYCLNDGKRHRRLLFYHTIPSDAKGLY